MAGSALLFKKQVSFLFNCTKLNSLCILHYLIVFGIAADAHDHKLGQCFHKRHRADLFRTKSRFKKLPVFGKGL
ncbi:hypothetical protein D9M68_929490 [compost metagenome]